MHLAAFVHPDARVQRSMRQWSSGVLSFDPRGDRKPKDLPVPVSEITFHTQVVLSTVRGETFVFRYTHTHDKNGCEEPRERERKRGVCMCEVKIGTADTMARDWKKAIPGRHPLARVWVVDERHVLWCDRVGCALVPPSSHCAF